MDIEEVEAQSAADSNTVILVDDDDDDDDENDGMRAKYAESIPVIDLDVYDEELSKRRRKKASNPCINFECECGENVREAPIFCLNYYRVKVKKTRMREICSQCYEIALKYYENLSSALKAGEYLIDQEFPDRDDYVEIDSDEEVNPQKLKAKNKGARILDEAQSFLIDNLPQTMNEVMYKYKMSEQASYACDAIEQRQNALADSLKELCTMQEELQQSVDVIRNNLYSTFQQQIKQLPAVEIIDTFIPLLPQKPMLTSPKTAMNRCERRSNRNINKPASYCELNDENPDSPAISSGADIQVINTTNEIQPLTNILIEESLPPIGALLRSRPQVGEMYYAMRQSVFGAWGRVRLLEIVQTGDGANSLMYKVKFESKIKGISGTKCVSGKELAYATPSPVRLDVGTRVIAVFLDETNAKKESFFTGVIAEPLEPMNHYRYLVFFDDGYAQYVKHTKVLVVVECSRNVWEDVHPESRHFIRKYLDTYPDRPMVKVQSGQVVKTEWNGKWWIARVVKVDGSLVHMHFDADSRSEWIYRGSTRLGPLFMEMQAAANRLERGPHIPKIQQNTKKNLPYVEYTRSQFDVETSDPTTTTTTTTTITPTSTLIASTVIEPAARAVARKSTRPPTGPASAIGAVGATVSPTTTTTTTTTYRFTPQPIPVSQNSNMVPFLPTQTQVQQPQSKVVYFTPKSVVAPRPYVGHLCSPKCMEHITLPLNALKGYNPLSKPLLCGWHRVNYRYKGKKVVVYKTPCGKSIRAMNELHRYLRLTKSDLSVDMFDFDFWVHCLAEFVLDKTYRSKRDISNGVENVPIPCVNYVDGTMPEFCNYSTQREPMEGVNLNLDPEFLCGCDCEDDCSDRTKCACWQLTIKEARTLNKRVPEELIGYTYKRLPEFVTTGIYECNARCKCASTCLNRVVQHPLQLKLQLFKTANRGWGIRCLNDIPQGAFICIYAGSLLTDKMANEGGVNYGDEYLAELDYIEVVERQKEGYESDASDIEEDDEDDEDDLSTTVGGHRRKMAEEDEDYRGNIYDAAQTESPIRTRARKRTAAELDEQLQKESIDPTATTTATTTTTTTSTNKLDEDSVTISDDDENVREPSRFAPSSDTNMDDNVAPLKFKSVRKYFGEDEVCYIMDAKNTGNIGRFLNHSCNPNVFVQNVFVDTHDLRFPWVAFFAMNYIRAGTELTWNYNYDVGSVPGKVIFCHCGSNECRGRLL